MSINFCSNCGNAVQKRIPEGDDRPRHICDACGMIFYKNPKLVVGCIPEWEDKILMCRRAIAPQIGKWTLPAGFLESAESVAEGARRETWEEANANVKILEPFALYNLTFVDQIYYIFRARLLSLYFGAGPESQEVMLMKETEIPWDEIAFEVIRRIMRHYFDDRSKGEFQFHMGDMEAKPLI